MTQAAPSTMLSALVEGNLADAHIEGVAVHVAGELALIEAIGRPYHLGENIAERVDSGGSRLGLVSHSIRRRRFQG